MNLDNLDIGNKFIVIAVNTTGEIRQRIIEMGFTPGVKGHVVRKAPWGDPIQVHIMDYEVSLRKSEALGIEVKLLEEEDTEQLPIDEILKKYKDFEVLENKDLSCRIRDKNENENEKDKVVVIALAGNPNAGKTTVFNALTGLNYRVANYPGVTVEKREGIITHNGITYKLIDLPGVYSLTAYSEDEVIACDYLLKERPDYIINVLDATNLERNMYLTLQLSEIDIPMISVLNMYESAEKSGIIINEKALSKLVKIPFMKVNGNKHSSVIGILDKIEEIENTENYKNEAAIYYGEDIERAIKIIASEMDNTLASYYKRWLALKILEKQENVYFQIRRLFKNAADIIELSAKCIHELEEKKNDKTDSLVAEYRYSYIRGALKETVNRKNIEAFNFTDAADVVFLNKYLGLPIFVVVLWLIFQLTFKLGSYPMDWLDMGLSMFSSFLSSFIPDGFFKSLLIDGIIGGVGSVVSFLPPILILFVGISFLEDTGYMARAAFLMDRIMHKLGLHGQSFIPLFMGFGCTVPAIIATRTLRSKKDRIVTILITTLMSCGARLPVYTLLIAAFFSPQLAPNILLSIYLIGVVMAFIMAFIFRKFFFKGEETPFVMELPPYRFPRAKTILRHMADRVTMYVKRAATYILVASVVMWALVQFPKYTPTEIDKTRFIIEAKNIVISKGQDFSEKDLDSQYNILVESEGLKRSIAGHIGTFIEPVIKPLGFDWRIGIALLAGMSAKEVVVSTIATIKGIESDDETTLKEALAADTFLTPLKAYSLMLFMLLYTPCLAAVVAISQEIGRKWMWLTVVYTLVLAWVVSFIFYNVASLFV